MSSKLSKPILIITLIALLNIFLVTNFVFAANNYGLPNKPISQILSDLIDWLLGLVTLLALLMLIIGAIMYLVSAGDEKRAEDAKKTITYAILGLVVAGISYTIVKTVHELLQ